MSQNMIKYHLIELSLFNTRIGSVRTCIASY
ncbi:hypothetical protein F383_28088 [Gossypium arboreum]|uniref:Uncharacterized protein n=1 Tax=Gossypium arboreum TaxID=29729 RepID=A0A0B0MY21_GOSAR|nr:hypothetical protein F383_28088 [Gossypium arboreum]